MSSSGKFSSTFRDLRTFISRGADDEWIDVQHEHIAEPYRPSQSQLSAHKNNPVPGSPPLKPPEAGRSFAEPIQTNTDTPDWGRRLKGVLPDILFGPASDRARELKHPSRACRTLLKRHCCSLPRSHSSIFYSRFTRDTSSPYWNKRSTELNGNSRMLLTGVVPSQRVSSLGSGMAASLPLASIPGGVARAKAKDDSSWLRRPEGSP